MKKILAAILLVTMLVVSISACNRSKTETFTVSFDTDGGSAVASVTVEDGAKVQKPADPTKEGYTFVGWYVGEAAYDFNSAVTANITLKAKWEANDAPIPPAPETFTVSFDADGGSPIAAVTVEKGQTATKPADPTRDGYTFIGWFVGETAYDFNSAVTADITLKAKWEEYTPPITPEPETFTVSFNTDGGSAVASVTVEEGQTATKPADPTKAGYTFIGWYVGDVEYAFDTPVTANVELTAKWNKNYVAPDLSAIAGTWKGVEELYMNIKNAYTVVITADGTITASYDTGSAVVDITVNSAAFDGTTLTINYVTFDNPEKTMEFTYNGDILIAGSAVGGSQLILSQGYTVTINPDNGSEATVKTVYYGETIGKPSNPTKTGYNFDNWYVGDEKYDFSTPVTGNLEIVAKWTAKTYKITFCAGSLSNKVLVLEGIEYGQVIPADKIPTDVVVAGYTFTGKWYTSLSTQTEEKLFDLTAPVTANKTIYAGLEEIQVPVSNLAGTWAGTEFVDYGYGVTENNEYTFVIDANGNVTGACIKNGTAAEVVVTSAKFNGATLTVVFTLDGSSKTFTFAYDSAANTLTKGELTLVKQYTVNFNVDGGSAVASQIVAEGSVATKPEDPTKEGYIFAGWYVGEEAYDFTSTVTEDVEIVAKWTEKPKYTVSFYDTGDTVIANQTVTEGAFAVIPEVVPTKAGYTFTYWGLGTEQYDFSTPITSNLVITANWKANTYTVTFKYDNGKEDLVKTVNHGDTVGKPSNPTKTGYTFVNWYIGEEAYVFTTPVTGDLEIVAKWTAKTYKITFCAGSLSNKVLILEGIEYGQTIPADKIPTDVVVEGYTFTGKWYTSLSTQTEEKLFDLTAPVTANKTIYAGLEEVLVSMAPLAGTWAGTEFVDYGYGVTENNEYTFVIDADGNVTGACIKNGTAAEVVVTSAKFNGATLTIAFTLDGSSKTFAFAYDSEANTLTKGELTLTKQVEKAKYTVNFFIDLDSDMISQTVTEGECAVMPEAPTKTGYNFLGWYIGDVEYDFATPITADVTISAKWEVKTYTVTFKPDNGKADTVKTVTHGDTVGKPSSPTKTGYTFVNWYIGEEAYVFTTPVTGDLEIVAKWTPKLYKVNFCVNSISNKVLTLEVPYGETVPVDQIPTDVTLAGYTFNGKWYTKTSPQDETTLFDFSTPITSTKNIYAGLEEVLVSMAPLAGTWAGTEIIDYGYAGLIDTNEYTFVIDTDGNVTGACIKNGTAAEVVVTSAKFNGATLTIAFTLDGSSKTYAFAYDSEANTLTKGELTLTKQVAE